MSHDVLTPETVKQLRDAGPKDLVWLLCDSHELLRERLAEAERGKTDAVHRAVKMARRAEQAEAKLAEVERARVEYLHIADKAERQLEQARSALREIADTFEIDWHEAQEIAREALAAAKHPSSSGIYEPRGDWPR